MIDIFEEIGKIFDPNPVFETNQGKMTGNQIVDHLTWCSYKAQRDYGISHERLMKIGLGTKEMDAKYNELKNPTNL